VLLDGAIAAGTLGIDRLPCRHEGPRCRDGHRLDVFGRSLARVTINGADVGSIMISEGLAVPYRPHHANAHWCDGAAAEGR
jgi:endonuclease YncB( thermonuclease family)